MKLTVLLFALLFPIYCFGQTWLEECAITEFSVNGIYGDFELLDDYGMTYSLDED